MTDDQDTLIAVVMGIHLSRLRIWISYTSKFSFHRFPCQPNICSTQAALSRSRAPFKNGITHTIQNVKNELESDYDCSGFKGGVYYRDFWPWHLGDDDEYQPNRRGFDEMFIHGAGGIGQNFQELRELSLEQVILGHLSSIMTSSQDKVTVQTYSLSMHRLDEETTRKTFLCLCCSQCSMVHSFCDNYKNMYKIRRSPIDRSHSTV